MRDFPIQMRLTNIPGISSPFPTQLLSPKMYYCQMSLLPTCCVYFCTIIPCQPQWRIEGEQQTRSTGTRQWWLSDQWRPYHRHRRLCRGCQHHGRHVYEPKNFRSALCCLGLEGMQARNYFFLYLAILSQNLNEFQNLSSAADANIRVTVNPSLTAVCQLGLEVY